MAFAVLQTIMILLNVAKWVIIVQAVLSWLIAFNVINMSNDVIRSIWIAIDRLTEPLYRPIRRILPDLGALDLSPMVVLLIIIILERAVVPGIAQSLLY